MIELQSQAMGIDLLQKETTRDGYEQEFKETVRSAQNGDLTGMVFGDIYLEEHKQWAERVCGALGIEAREPLWGEQPERLLSDFVDAGFVAVIVSAQSDIVDKDWIGHELDRTFLEYLRASSIDLCGENGEYHTLVTDGPLFKKRIEISKSRTVKKDNFWFLDTVEYKLVDKP